MSNSVHITMPGTGSDAFLTLDVGAPSDLYTAFEIYFPASYFTGMTGVFGTDSLYIEDTLLHFVEDIFPFGSVGSYAEWSDDWFESSQWSVDFPPNGLAGTWVFIESWIPRGSGGVGYYSINGQKQTDQIDPSIHQPRYLHLGMINTNGSQTAQDVWINRVQVGTTEFGSDILNFDPATDNFATAFTGTTGTVANGTPPLAQPAQFGFPSITGEIEVSPASSKPINLASDAAIGYALQAPASQIYVEAAIYIVPGSLASWVINPYVLKIQQGPFREGPVSQGILAETGTFEVQSDGTLFGTPVEGAWQVYKIWLHSGGGYVEVDGVRQTFTGAPTTIQAFYAGVMSNDGNPGPLWVGYLFAGSTEGGQDIFFYTPGSTADEYPQVVNVTGTTSRSSAPTPPPDPPPPPTPPGPISRQRYYGYEWRFTVTDLQYQQTTWAQGLMTDRQVTLKANAPGEISASVYPDDPRINQLISTDGGDHYYPRLAQSNRIVWAWRREGNGPNGPDFSGCTVFANDSPWRLRAAGILMMPDDTGDTDTPITRFTAYDPLMLLDARAVVDTDGQLPGPNGFSMFTSGEQIALTFLKNTIVADGGVFIDAGLAYGGTDCYNGTIETCPTVAYTAQQGTTVGQVFQDLINGGNMDIRLEPIWDPGRINPNDGSYFTHELSIYAVSNTYRANAMLGWNKLNRCVANIERTHDATPGGFINTIQYFSGQGGFPIPPTGPLVVPESVAGYGTYWATQFFPAQLSLDPTGAQTLALAQMALHLAKQGQRTLLCTLISGRGPVAITDFDILDLVQIHATNALRVTADGKVKVMAIPINIADDGVEEVTQLLLNPDYRTEAYPVEGGS